MAKTKRKYIFFTCVTSGIAALLSFVSLGTEQWVTAEGRIHAEQETDQAYQIKYGMFSGVYTAKIGKIPLPISMTCLYDGNVCAMLCTSDSQETREEQLQRLVKHEKVSFNCRKIEKEIRNRLLPTTRAGDNKFVFISAGSYLSTIIFLVISGVLGVFSAGLSVWNTGGNPYQAYFSIYGLYYYNAAAALSILLTICIWGGEFTAKLIDNVAVLDTIVGSVETKGSAGLGFSYWINLGSFFLYLASIGLLWTRQFLIEREPEVKIDLEDTNENILPY